MRVLCIVEMINQVRGPPESSSFSSKWGSCGLHCEVKVMSKVKKNRRLAETAEGC